MEKSLLGFKILEIVELRVKYIIIQHDDGSLFPSFLPSCLVTCLLSFSCLCSLASLRRILLSNIHVCIYNFFCVWRFTRFHLPPFKHPVRSVILAHLFESPTACLCGCHKWMIFKMRDDLKPTKNQAETS